MGRRLIWIFTLLVFMLLLPVFASAEIKVHFIDVGQGDSILVQCDGETLLVDAGPEDAGTRVNNYIRELQGLDNLDYLIVTHEHDDHLGGMESALAGMSVNRIYSSTGISSSYWFQTLLPVLKQESLEVNYPSPNDSFQLGGATVTFVNPLTDSEKVNDCSLVVRIEYGDTAVLQIGRAHV